MCPPSPPPPKAAAGIFKRTMEKPPESIPFVNFTVREGPTAAAPGGGNAGSSGGGSGGGGSSGGSGGGFGAGGPVTDTTAGPAKLGLPPAGGDKKDGPKFPWSQ